MKRLGISFVTFCLVMSVSTGDAMAQRGRRGGGRGRPGGGMAGGAVQRAPSVPNRAGQQVRPPIRPNNGGPKFQPPGKDRPGVGDRGDRPGGRDGLRNVYDVLGVTPPAAAHAQNRNQYQNVLGWVDSANPPFSAAWYAAHPNAWQFTHPHADAVVAATAAGLVRWLAVPYPVATTGSATSTTVVTEGQATTTEPAVVVDDPAPPYTDEVDDGTQWMNIGVFALKPTGQSEATRVIQLAVRRDGTIRGSHYDLLSDEVQDLRGNVDKSDLQVAWTIGQQGQVVFEVPLQELSRPAGNVTAHFPDGKKGSWQTVRVEQ